MRLKKLKLVVDVPYAVTSEEICRQNRSWPADGGGGVSDLWRKRCTFTDSELALMCLGASNAARKFLTWRYEFGSCFSSMAAPLSMCEERQVCSSVLKSHRQDPDAGHLV